MDIINIGTLSELFVVQTSLREQQAIVSFLGEQTAKIDTLITETQSAIELLKEHRSALITNAVTGKINVVGLVNAR